jgi:hypothetical protein
MLKPQDVYVLLKLVPLGGRDMSYAKLGVELLMPASEVHASLARCRESHLIRGEAPEEVVNLSGLEEFLLHGIQYAFPVIPGELTRGVPTSYAAPPLSSFVLPGDDPPPVWPSPVGKVRGYAIQPLYRKAPAAALNDPIFYELLALSDALRQGKARERNQAAQELRKRLFPDAKSKSQSVA